VEQLERALIDYESVHQALERDGAPPHQRDGLTSLLAADRALLPRLDRLEARAEADGWSEALEVSRLLRRVRAAREALELRVHERLVDLSDVIGTPDLQADLPALLQALTPAEAAVTLPARLAVAVPWRAALPIALAAGLGLALVAAAPALAMLLLLVAALLGLRAARGLRVGTLELLGDRLRFRPASGKPEERALEDLARGRLQLVPLDAAVRVRSWRAFYLSSVDEARRLATAVRLLQEPPFAGAALVEPPPGACVLAATTWPARTTGAVVVDLRGALFLEDGEATYTAAVGPAQQPWPAPSAHLLAALLQKLPRAQRTALVERLVAAQRARALQASSLREAPFSTEASLVLEAEGLRLVCTVGEGERAAVRLLRDSWRARQATAG
jgi:hypothetical protein